MVKTKPAGWKGSPAYWRKLADIYSARFRANPGSYLYVPLADALMNLGRLDDAIETLEYGLALLPSSRAAQVLLAQLYYDVGRKEKSRVILEGVVERWPDVPAAVSLLCKIYEKEGAFRAAKMISLALLDYYPDAPYVRNLVAHYEQLDGPGEMSVSIAPDDLAPAGRKKRPGAPAAARVTAAVRPPVNGVHGRPGSLSGGGDAPPVKKSAEPLLQPATIQQRKPRRRNKQPDPRQETLFTLSSMLAHITKMKQEN